MKKTLRISRYVIVSPFIITAVFCGFISVLIINCSMKEAKLFLRDLI
jgi:hypothetical protein